MAIQLWEAVVGAAYFVLAFHHCLPAIKHFFS